MLPLRGVPEVQRADLSWVVLQLKALGVSDVAHFDFLSPPSPAAMVRALELLYSLGALDDSCALTPCGEVMAELPLEPRLSRALLASRDRGCEDAMLSVAAMLSVQGPWMPMRSTRDARERLREAMKAQADPLGDHVTYLHLYRDWSSQSEGSRVSWCDETCIDSRAMVRAGEVRMQLARYLRRLDPSKAEPLERHGDEEKTELLKAFVTGFFSHAARLCPDGRYRTLRTGAALECHPTSVTVHRVRPAEYIMYNEVVRTSELYARDVSTIQPRWLSELAPHFYEVKGDRGGEGLKRRRELMEEEMSLRGGAVRA
jgi:ATP-dependent RNA helicase DDX35